jgi:hypothetical protein
LKAYVSVAGPDLIAVGSSEMAKDILRVFKNNLNYFNFNFQKLIKQFFPKKQMKELAEYRKYQVITIPDPNGVNCVYLNSTLFHCSLDELPNSAKVIYIRFEKNKRF